MTRNSPDHEVSSGNVFADLGLPDSEELLAKAALDRDVQIVVTPKPRSRRHATTRVTGAVAGPARARA